MRDDFDIEDALRRHRCDPSPRVKQSVLAELDRTRRHGSIHRGAAGFWKRPVPLYVAAAALVIVVGLAFAAGRMTSWTDRQSGLSGEPSREKNDITSRDIHWVAAENDLL